MTESEILDERIETLRKRYTEAINQGITVLSWEKTKLSRKDFYECGALIELQNSIKLSSELNALLFLKRLMTSSKFVL
jgi:hypothetical protein